jgi:hypothetical protein
LLRQATTWSPWVSSGIAAEGGIRLDSGFGKKPLRQARNRSALGFAGQKCLRISPSAAMADSELFVFSEEDSGIVASVTPIKRDFRTLATYPR